MKVKVCGITRTDDALMCEALGADALGYIFYPKSKRYIAPEEAGRITRSLSLFTLRVGVFVDEDYEVIMNTVKEAGLNAVQLHGSETPEFVNRFKLPVIKSFRVGNDFSFHDLFLYNSYYLLDSYKEGEPGGTGLTFDWNIIPADLRNKIILAGGVSANNIEHIYNNINPAAVDLSSSIETVPGEKDIHKTEDFFNKLNSLRRTNGYNDETKRPG